MGKGSELLQLLKTGNTEQARRLAAKLKKQGKKKFLAALNDQDEDGYTPLHYSAAYNFLDFLEEFIENGATIDIGDQKGATPLHLAALNGRLEATRILLHRGADPNIAARSGDTPLHLGALNGHADVVEALVREHAKCAMLNVSGQTSLDLACQNGHAAVVAILLRSGQFSQSYLQHSDIPQTAMKLAAKHGHTEVLNLLVKHGFDVNKLLPGAHGTCLHEAALYGKIDTVKFLLQAGADPSITNTQGLTALEIVNQYTDPRSANQLKLILQEALANQARVRIANHHQQQQLQRPMSYAPSHVQAQQQFSYERSQSLSHSQNPQSQATSAQPQSQAAQPPHIQQQRAYHQAYQQAFYAQHRQQRPQTQTQPYAQAYGQSYTQQQQQQQQQQQPQQQQAYSAQQQQQAYTQQQQPAYAAQQQQQQAYAAQQQAYAQQQQAYTQQQPAYTQPATTATPQPASPLTTAKAVPQGGGMDFASMIAAKAAMRKQASTESPGFGEEGGPVRSSTLSSGSRLQRPQSQKRERRSSLTEESMPSTQSSEFGNAPTLPRRSNQGPPGFKPGPPPDTISQSSSSSSLSGTSAPPPLRKVEKPKPAPPPAAAPSMDNELMAKLRRRQQTIEDDKVRAESEEREEHVHEPQEASLPPPPPPPREDSASQPQPEPPKVAAKPPKTRPKPVKEDSPKPAVKEDSPKPSWQEEVARRKAERKQKEEQEEKEEFERQERERLEREQREQEEKERLERERLEAEQREKERLERERLEAEQRDRERLERERKEREQLERERMEKERLESEQRERERIERERAQQEQLTREQEKQRQELEVAELKRRSVASQGTPERQVPPPVKAKPPVPPPVVVDDISNTRMPTMTSDEESLPSTTPTSEMFESGSVTSLPAAPVGSATNMHSQAAFECIPIADWLMTYKLSEYITLFENNGYDNTDFLLGISVEELTDLGISKPGHRRRMMAALGQLLPKEHFLTIKPASVGEWLMQLGLNRYEDVMMESGYDDIDFVSSITEEELMEIGIAKKGHLKRFRKGVQELIEMQKSEPATPSPFTQPFNQLNIQSSPSHSISNLSASSQNLDQASHRDSIAVSENDVIPEHTSPGASPGKPDASEGRPRASSSEHPPAVAARPSRSSRHENADELPTTAELSTACSQDSGIESMGAPRHGNNFSKMKIMLEKRMGIREGEEEESDKETTPPPHPVEAPPLSPKQRKPVAPPPPKRANSTVLSGGAGKEESPLVHSKHAIATHNDTDYVNEIPPPVPQHRNSQVSEYTAADVAVVDTIGSSPSSTEGTPVRTVPGDDVELDELDRVLKGFDSGPTTSAHPQLAHKTSVDGEEQTDQLLADIDNMLADLNTHLDIMIPGGDTSNV